MRILAISGSLRRGSHNTELLRTAAALAPPGVEVELWDGLRAIPPYDPDAEGATPPAVLALRRAIAEADAVLFATPEYNSSIPGVLKNALDWLSRPLKDSPLRNKPVAVVSTSTGAFGGVWAAAELRKVLGAIGARNLDVDLSVPFAHVALAQAPALDPDLEQRLASVCEALAQEVETRVAA